MHDILTYSIIGCAQAVHRELGTGFLEAVYQEAMTTELTTRDIPFVSQPTLPIFYKGNRLSQTYQPDFVCYKNIVVELKALSRLSGTEKAQVINYLKASRLKVGLLLNIGQPSLDFMRLVRLARTEKSPWEKDILTFPVPFSSQKIMKKMI